MITLKTVCAGDFWLVYELAQLFRFIDKSCWAGLKTSQKSPTQTAFAVVLSSIIILSAVIYSRIVILKMSDLKINFFN